MSIIDQFKRGTITKQQLLEQAKNDPKLARQARHLLVDEYMSMEELDQIAAAGITGTDKDDTLTGGGENNSMFGLGGDDSLEGGGGDDELHGGSGNDYLDGGEGDDTLYGNAGEDYLDGGKGDDKLYGGKGDDSLDGGKGKDKVAGGDGDDIVHGGEGDDWVMGEAGNDDLYGDAGDDFLDGGDGDNTLTGGEGRDAFIFQKSATGTDTITDFTQGEDSIILTDEEYTMSYDPETGTTTIVSGDKTIIVQGVELTEDDIHLYDNTATDGDDFLMGTNFYNGATLDGGAGNDTIEGFFEDDTIIGGTGDDTLAGGHGNDTFVFKAGDGNDVIKDFKPGEDTIQLSGINGDEFTLEYDPQTGNTTISYDGGTITVEGVEITKSDISLNLEGDARPDTFEGSDGNDSISGGSGHDTITGGSGDDTLEGGSGNDTLDGGTGDDTLSGGSGDDTMDGGQGDDTLTGGEGADTFTFGTDDGDDTITDYTPGEDVLKLPGEYEATYDEETGNTTITYEGGTITVEGVSPDDIDILWEGTEGDDTFQSGEGNDTFTGGEGNNTYNFSLNDGDNTITDFDPEKDTLNFVWDDPGARGSIRHENGNTVITYPGGSITLVGVELDLALTNFTIHGTDGDDILAAHGGTNINYGGDGDDTIYGKGGDDFLYGGSGNDTIKAGDDNDYLEGGSGNDTLTGGGGADTFVFGMDDGNDTVTDFNPSKDTLQLLGVGSMDDISVKVENGNTIITYGDTTITLEGVEMTQEEVWARVE